MTNTASTEGELRKQLEKNDRLYQNLAHLHRQEHDPDNCFCTTEISGAYRNVLDEIATVAHRYAAIMAREELNEARKWATKAETADQVWQRLTDRMATLDKEAALSSPDGGTNI